MPSRDNLDLSNKNFLDFLVDYRRLLVSLVIVVTVVLTALLPRMQTDPSLKTGIDATSPAYRQYEKFVETFGEEEFILVVVKPPAGATDPRMMSALEKITGALEGNDKVVEVISLTNLRVFQKRDDLFGGYPVLVKKDDHLELPAKSDLEKITTALPVTDFLVSRDRKTLGVLVRMAPRFKFDPVAAKQLAAEAQQAITQSVPPGTEYRIVGAPLVREAIVKYSIQTGIVFGILCMLIATLVSVYIFKSLRITAITNAILAVCIVWILGLMSALHIPLNSTTALAFGFIPITTIEIVIHMVVRYYQFHEKVRNKIGAVKQAVRWLARPSFICSATTAVGFGTLMISSIPMVRQLGFIMSTGIMISYCLAFILVPAFFVAMKSLDAPDYSGILRDWLDRGLSRVEHSIFRYYRWFVALGVCVTVFLFAGAPMIRSDIQVLRMLSESTDEIKDLKFVETNLTPVNSVELMLEAEPNAFRRTEVWKKVWELETRVRDIPEVVSTDSFLPLLDYLNRLADPDAKPYEKLFSKPELVPQLLYMTSMSTDGRRVIRRFTDENFSRLRISVRVKNSPTVPISKTIEDIQSLAASVMAGVARATVTGDLAVFSGQTSDLIRDQIKSMAIAAVVITILMMIQMGSPVLGLISLIPNIPPIAAVFGLMGWFGIALDGVTIFAATVVLGLAVDNTIHFLTQLKREIKFHPGTGVEECVRQAYKLTAKQIVSWSTVILMGFLALAVSPFRPVVLFGLLGGVAISLGLFGDLIFIQSLILASPRIRNSITRLIEREVTAGR